MSTNGKGYFSPRHICESLGISWPRQSTKIKEDSVLSSGVALMATTATDGKNYDTLMLPIEMAPGWLFTIRRVKPEVQWKLDQFRLECFVALDAWFNKGMRRDEAGSFRPRIINPHYR